MREDEGGSGDGLAGDEQGGGEETVVEQEGSPGEEAAGKGLPEAGAGDLGDEAAAFEEGKDGIDLEGEGGGEDDGDPGEEPGDRVGRIADAWKKKMPAGTTAKSMRTEATTYQRMDFWRTEARRRWAMGSPVTAPWEGW